MERIKTQDKIYVDLYTGVFINVSRLQTVNSKLHFFFLLKYDLSLLIRIWYIPQQ